MDYVSSVHAKFAERTRQQFDITFIKDARDLCRCAGWIRERPEEIKGGTDF